MTFYRHCTYISSVYPTASAALKVQRNQSFEMFLPIYQWSYGFRIAALIEYLPIRMPLQDFMRNIYY